MLQKLLRILQIANSSGGKKSETLETNIRNIIILV